MPRKMTLLLLALTLSIPAESFAVSIFVNGTKVDGALSNFKMDKCSAFFEANGDLKLDCPGYIFSAETATGEAAQQAAAAPAIPGKITKQYILVSSQSLLGATGFDVDVFINGKEVIRLKNKDEQVVEDVTKFLRPGENTVTFVSRKKPITEVKASPEDFYEIMIGEGVLNKETVMIEEKNLVYRLTAAESSGSQKEMKINAR